MARRSSSIANVSMRADEEEDEERAEILAQFAQPRPSDIDASAACATNAQIVGMLELAAKNKISMRNAFELRLIDALPTAVKNETFTHCGSMIDASAKIYAYRVDKTHLDVFRMRATLGKEDAMNFNDAGDEDDNAPDNEKKKTRKLKSVATIEGNTRAISTTVCEVEVEEDALFRRTVSAFDEGASTGLLLNQALTSSDAGHVLLHGISFPPVLPMEPSCDSTLDTALLGVLDGIKSNEGEEEATLLHDLDDFQFSRLNVSAVNMEDVDAMDWSNGEDDQGPVLNLSDRENIPVVDNIMMKIVESETADDNKDLHPEDARLLKKPTRFEKLQNLMTAGHLQDLSYFDQNKLNAVKGPNHWKIIATPRGSDSKRRMASKNTTRKQKEPRKRRKMKLELDESDPEDQMTLAAIRKHYKIAADPQKLLMPASQLVSDRHQLDYVLDYDKNLLIRLGIRPEVTISRLQSAPPRAGDGDDLSEPYDYDNANDSHSFTGRLPVRAQSEQGMAFEGIAPPENSQFNLSVDDDQHNNNKQFFGKPVDYAKRQKKIDAKALKRSMRKILQPSKNGVGNKDFSSSVESRNRQFSALCQALPGSVDRVTAADLSVPIIFVVFLHLCNENGLELEQMWTMDNQNAMEDFIIHQPTSSS